MQQQGSNIPAARDIILGVIGEIGDADLKVALIEAYSLMRRRSGSRTKAKSLPVTDEMRRKMVELRAQGMSLQEIADDIGVNQGRVSEALAPTQ